MSRRRSNPRQPENRKRDRERPRPHGWGFSLYTGSMIITERGDIDSASQLVTVRLPAEILKRLDATGNRNQVIIRALERYFQIERK